MERHGLAAALLLLLSACGGGGSPVSPSPSAPNVQGQFVGIYAVSSCVDDGYLAGRCLGTIGRTGDLRLTLTQSQSTVMGSVVLGGGLLGTSGTFQGSVSPAGGVAGSATLGTFTVGGVPEINSITSWNTTLVGDSLTGSFALVSRTTAPAGTRTIIATIVNLSRIPVTGVVGGFWTGRATPSDGSAVNSSTVTFTLTQNGDGVTGSVTLVGLVDLATFRGPVTGTVSGTTFTFAFSANASDTPSPCSLAANGSAQVGPGGPPDTSLGSMVMRGSYAGTSNCPGGRYTAGSFTLTRQ